VDYRWQTANNNGVDFILNVYLHLNTRDRSFLRHATLAYVPAYHGTSFWHDFVL